MSNSWLIPMGVFVLWCIRGSLRRRPRMTSNYVDARTIHHHREHDGEG